jgi:hypothetical protein
MKIYSFIKKIFNQLFNRKENTMSLEKQAESLLESVKEFIDSVKDSVRKENAAIPVSGAALDSEKLTKKELSELKKAAKAKAGRVLKELGKEKLSELLSRFGSGKFSELLNEADTFTRFIEVADEMLIIDGHDTNPTNEDDDLLGDGPAEKEYTIEDVKKLLLKVNNAPTLGRAVTREILADLGVARLPELKKDKFAQAIEKIEATLEDAGVE